VQIPGPKKTLFVSRRTRFYGRRTACSARKDSLFSLTGSHCASRPMMLRLSVSVSCIRYSKGAKFRPKKRQNAFSGRAMPGPAGGA